jgi:hypothetical protein
MPLYGAFFVDGALESLLSKATAMKNDEGRSPDICFLKWSPPMSERSEDNPSLSAGSKASTFVLAFVVLCESEPKVQASIQNNKSHATKWHGF